MARIVMNQGMSQTEWSVFQLLIPKANNQQKAKMLEILGKSYKSGDGFCPACQRQGVL